MYLVIAGPGGVGKGTVVSLLRQLRPDIHVARSWTTRKPRPGEPGDAYVYVTRTEFDHALADGVFLESNEFHDNRYGTPLSELDRAAHTILEVDVNGAIALLQRLNGVQVVFIDLPDEELRRRLEARGAPPAFVDERTRIAAVEREQIKSIAATIMMNWDSRKTARDLAEWLVAADRGEPGVSSQ
jgi:guanylate kinase